MHLTSGSADEKYFDHALGDRVRVRPAPASRDSPAASPIAARAVARTRRSAAIQPRLLSRLNQWMVDSAVVAVLTPFQRSGRIDLPALIDYLQLLASDWSRDIRDGELIQHSDRGSTYTAIRFANRLADNGIAQSMGSVGDSYDNALMENFFSTLKTELVYRPAWRTRDEAENALFAYIDGWYNSQRIQKKLGWRSPAEFEASYHHPVPAGT